MVEIRFPKIENRALKYGYSNARVKGMKGLLLTKAQVDELLKVKSIDAVVELLQRTSYRDDLAPLSLMHKGSSLVELAAGRHFARVCRKVIKITPVSDKPAVEALVKRWDLLNLRILLTAKRLGKKYEDIKYYTVPVGTLTERDMDSIFRADERKIFEEVQRTEFGRDMLSQSSALFNREMWSVFKNALKNMDSFMQLQTVLDAYMYTYVDKHMVSGSKDVGRIKTIFRKEIDAKNVALIERLKARNMDRKEIRNYIIRGGSFSDMIIEQLIEAKDFNAVVAVARQKLSGLEEKSEMKNLVELETALDKAVAREKLHAFYRSSLSVGALLGFILLKEEELNNLRKIAKAKEFGLPEEKIKEMLIMV